MEPNLEELLKEVKSAKKPIDSHHLFISNQPKLSLNQTQSKIAVSKGNTLATIISTSIYDEGKNIKKYYKDLFRFNRQKELKY